MKFHRVSPMLAIALAVVLSACGTCPPGTAENLANVQAIVAENDAVLASAPAAVANAKRLRNAAALDLATKLDGACR